MYYLCKYIKICGLFKNVLIFQGIERISDITGKPELYYPEWKRNAFRYFVTVPVIVFCLTVVFVSVFLILELQVKKYVPQKSQFDISNLILQINVFHIQFAQFIVNAYFKISFFIIFFQQWWDIVIREKGYMSFLSYLPKIMLAIVIPVLDSFYNKVAFWLNDMGESCISFFS